LATAASSTEAFAGELRWAEAGDEKPKLVGETSLVGLPSACPAPPWRPVLARVLVALCGVPPTPQRAQVLPPPAGFEAAAFFSGSGPAPHLGTVVALIKGAGLRCVAGGLKSLRTSTPGNDGGWIASGRDSASRRKPCSGTVAAGGGPTLAG